MRLLSEVITYALLFGSACGLLGGMVPKLFMGDKDDEKKRKKEIDEIYDILGIRVICNTTVECYTILGIIHSMWIPIEGRFKD